MAKRHRRALPGIIRRCTTSTDGARQAGQSGRLPGLRPGSRRIGDQFAPDPRAARAYREIDKVYATLTTFTDPLFRSMADGLQGLERAPGPGRR
jgi:hypothetical protein